MNAPSRALALPDLQAALHTHLLTGERGVAAQVVGGGVADAASRLHVYRHAYRERLLEALRDSFEATRGWLGDERFDAAAYAYIDAHAPTARSLRNYGSRLPAWLHGTQADDGAAGELAELDWQLRAAFDGPDAEPLPLQALQPLTAADWQRVGLRFAPTMRRLTVRGNTLALWHAIDRDLPPPPVECRPQPMAVLVWRKGLQPHFRSAGTLEVAALDALCAGTSFAGTCDSLAQRFAECDVAAESAVLLRRWFDDELVVGLVTTR
jgi:hypothetical protein